MVLGVETIAGRKQSKAKVNSCGPFEESLWEPTPGSGSGGE